ncbi:MAG: DUF6785 family protein [Kiritimatiellia bacterium]
MKDKSGKWGEEPKRNRITLRSFLLGMIFAGLFAWYTVYQENVPGHIITSTQIAVLPYILLAVGVVLINPLLKFVRFIRRFTPTELLIVFVMGAVSGGVSTFGLASQLVPLTSGLFNPDWNNMQSRWDLYVEPYVNDDFFVAEDGIREAAIEARDAELKWDRAKKVYRAAANVQAAAENLEEVTAKLHELEKIPDEKERTLRAEPLRHQVLVIRQALERAREAWKEYEGEYNRGKVLDTFPEKIRLLQETKDERAGELAEAKAGTFETVEQFRRGLPGELRAVPGFIYDPGEGLHSYMYRVRRFSRGTDSLELLEKARSMLEDSSGPRTGKEAAALIAEAAGMLEPLAGLPELEERQADLEAKINNLREEIGDEEKHLRLLREQRRYAMDETAEELTRRIKKVQKWVDKKKKNLESLNSRLDRKVKPSLATAGVVAETMENLEELSAESETAVPGGCPALVEKIESEMAAFRTFDGDLRTFAAGNVPWKKWVGPLAKWAVVILLTYTVLMTFNVLIFRQWAYNEKLIYPLAELPTYLSGAYDENGGRVPALYRNGMFWTGAAISIGVMGWNLLATKQIIPGAGDIALRYDWTPYIQNSPFAGLLPNAHHQIIFTLVGLTFLIPAKISFSLWFFHLVFMVLTLVLVWMGYGENLNSFPKGMTSLLNFRTAIGGGALTAFAAVILWKCRQYLFCAFRPGAVSELEKPERTELRISSFLFVFCSAGLVGVLTWGLGANIYFSIFVYLVVLVITIGLVRAVTEGGLLGFQCFFGPFHLIRHVVGMNKAWTAAPLLAPLVCYLYIFFWDIKAFIAPAMANALKVRDNVKMGRLRFHTAVAFGILAATVVAIATHIILGYKNGADGMHGWFYSTALTDIFSEIKNMAQSEPTDVAGGKYWLLTGVIVMGALIFLRQRVFWLPHPIGLIMWVNPLMWQYWFSILLGWLFKTMVSKYGDNRTYAQFRAMFIGLILGELFMCLFGVTLNRF